MSGTGNTVSSPPAGAPPAPGPAPPTGAPLVLLLPLLLLPLLLLPLPLLPLPPRYPATYSVGEVRLESRGCRLSNKVRILEHNSLA